VKHWISQGAQVSTTLHNLFINMKIISGKKINALPKKTAPKKEAPAAPAEVAA
jgi:ribosomal protein S16